MKSRRVACIGLALAIGLCGCVTRRGELPETVWPLAAAQAKHSVSVVVAADVVTVNEVPVDVPITWSSFAREHVRETYADSGLFTALLAEDELADLRSEVHLSGVLEYSRPLAMLSGLTLFLVPTNTIYRYTMRTELRSAEGEVLLSIERSETLVRWDQAFLVFTVPFQDQDGGAGRLMRDLSRATLDEAHAKGVL